MILETGALSYWRGNRSGDVKPEQNNFAGLGATGNGVRGESFKDVETGVRAHLEHFMLYAGRPVESPVAERTRKVHEWRILVPGSSPSSGRSPLPISPPDGRPAPGTIPHGAADCRPLPQHVCAVPDPRPELVREARATSVAKDAAGPGKAADEAAPRRVRRARSWPSAPSAQAKEDGIGKRSGLGVQPPPEAAHRRPTRFPDTLAVRPMSGADQGRHRPRRRRRHQRARQTPAKSGRRDKVPARAGPRRRRRDQGQDDARHGPAPRRQSEMPGLDGKLRAAEVHHYPLDLRPGGQLYGARRQRRSEQREADAFIAAYAKNGKIAASIQPGRRRLTRPSSSVQRAELRSRPGARDAGCACRCTLAVARSALSVTMAELMPLCSKARCVALGLIGRRVAQALPHRPWRSRPNRPLRRRRRQLPQHRQLRCLARRLPQGGDHQGISRATVSAPSTASRSTPA